MCPFGNGSGFQVRFGAELVIEVRHNDPVPGCIQDVQQAQAVGSAGDARQDWFLQIESALVPQDIFEHQSGGFGIT